MNRYICIHGHFYQPPRENAWLEEVEIQDSAYPYHDWNERITAECYAANAASRILNPRGGIIDIVNNYGRISFNFGPTLLAWMEKHAPTVYEKIQAADAESRRRFSGHGSAMAQAYNHMIMPLADAGDKKTQILWGIADFRHRFGRDPEGMWLPETAVDMASLELMAEHGIRFTVLSPFQAAQVRPLGTDQWTDVDGGSIDPATAYAVSLASGRPFAIFFYDSAISQAVAFEGVLNRGEAFAERLMSGFSEDRAFPQLLHIATDGESYGHHHRHGDMALAYALHYIQEQNLAKITNYGEFLEKHPPSHEVKIHENTAWSCAHGVDRWRADCGCSSGVHPDWHQQWRQPLRQALDWLRDAVKPLYEKRIGRMLNDPARARNDYIGVLLNRSPETVAAFFNMHAAAPLDDGQKITCLKLLELQRHAMLMYTSCGWFFDDISGIETSQIIQYAGRVLQIAADVFSEELEAGFLSRLEKAPSNIAAHQNGRRVYEKFVRPAMVDLESVCAHDAISSIFSDDADYGSIFCYQIKKEALRTAEVGASRLALGRSSVRSAITQECRRFRFGVLHWGDHNISGCIQAADEKALPVMEDDAILNMFNRAAFPETLQLLEKHLGPAKYSLRSLFRDQQRNIIKNILAGTLETVQGVHRQLCEANTPLLRFLKDAGMPAPKALLAAAETIFNADIEGMIIAADMDPANIRRALEEADLAGVQLDVSTLEMAVRRRLENAALRLSQTPRSLEGLGALDTWMTVLSYFPFETDLRRVQNHVYALLIHEYPKVKQRASRVGGSGAQEWVTRFESVCRKLSLEIAPAAEGE